MALVSFVGVFYPLRSFMRYLWLGAAPLFTAIIPILGSELFVSRPCFSADRFGGGVPARPQRGISADDKC